MMTPEKFFECWMTGGPAAREAMRSDVAALLQAERERCAVLVDTYCQRTYSGNAGPSTQFLMVKVAGQIRQLI